MLHIYRQITALERFRPVVIARKREHAGGVSVCADRAGAAAGVAFPAALLVSHGSARALANVARARHGESSRLSPRTTRNCCTFISATSPFILLPLMRRWPKPVVVSFHGADVMVDLDKPRYRSATQTDAGKPRGWCWFAPNLSRGRWRSSVARARKIRVHRTGIPLGAFPFQERTWPNDGAWRFLQAGRLIEKKGFATSLRAFAAFRQDAAASDVYDLWRRADVGGIAAARAGTGRRRERAFYRAFFRRRNCALPSNARIFFSTRAKSAPMEIRRACRTRCSRRWRAAFRFSRRGMAESRRRLRTA